MVEYSDEVKTLAETLKNSGLAASMIDALERAQSILDGTKPKPKEEGVKGPAEAEIGASQTTLGGVNHPEENRIKVLSSIPRAKPEDSNYPPGIKAAEPSESIEIEEGLKEEEVFTEKTEQKQESNQNNTNNSQQKKIDLSEIFNVNK